jgi:hypothetical protein
MITLIFIEKQLIILMTIFQIVMDEFTARVCPPGVGGFVLNGFLLLSS